MKAGKITAKPAEPRSIQQEGVGDVGHLLIEPVSMAQLRMLPTTADGLRDHIRELVARAANPRDAAELNDATFAIGRQIIVNLPVSPAVRAAAYRMIASLPDVRALGEVTDILGRTGQGVARVTRDFGGEVEERLVMDESTGLPLFVGTVAKEAGKGRRMDQLVGYTAIKETGWTDQQPVLPNPDPQ
jgi:hypothetical protein